ncbi:hypothetical protein BKA61DRAFT_735131 [Leptodontidium sp. MPI-SDFR-AT-0119]|nr:hypothetical protein BKA61DRAFT_735131 [Leptodontidium sp. MPI-SDFR-AT-0119]
MQRKDPLAIQVWRLYSKAGKRLPNQERMENLTWRMMATSLQTHKQEEATRLSQQNSPPGSTCPSAISTRQPILKNEQKFFNNCIDIRQQQIHAFSQGPSSLSNLMAQQYMYDANGDSIRWEQLSTLIDLKYSNPNILFRHRAINIGHENMFSYGGDSHNDDEQGTAFADRTLIMQPELARTSIEDLSIEMGPGEGLQWDTSCLGQFNTQAAQHADGLLEQVTIEGTTSDIVSSPPGWEGSGSCLGRRHASTQSFSENRPRIGSDRQQKIPLLPLAPYASAQGDNDDLHELLHANYTSLAKKSGRPSPL